MTTILHATLAAGRWQELSLVDQLANIGSEVGRASRAKANGNVARFEGALMRGLELFDLTLADDRWRGAPRREIARAREVVCDFLVGDNECGSSDESLDRYFLPFAVAARREKATSVSREAKGERRDPPASEPVSEGAGAGTGGERSEPVRPR